MADLFDRLNFLQPISSKNIKDYEKEILYAKQNNLAVLAETKRTETGKEIFLVKEIESVSKVNAISAYFMYVELGEILAINGKGYKYIEKPKLKQNPFDLITDEFCLVFAKNNYPKLVCYNWQSLLEVYTLAVKELIK